MSSPLVSIVVPTYNRPEFLRRAVVSCLAQTYQNFEVVVTDNSTNEDSAKMMATFTDPRVRYSSNGANLGPVGSTMRALGLSKGKHIKILMDDDLLKPRCLELMVEALEKNPTAVVAMAPMDLIDRDDRRIYPRFYVFRRMTYRYRYQIGDGLVGRERLMRDFLTRDYPCTVPSGLMYRADALREAGPFSEKAGFAGDLEMVMRLASRHDFYYIDEVLTSWRFTPISETAGLHQTGLKIELFYYITRLSLDNPDVKKMFSDEWSRMVKDSLFFCSCRALLNGLAGIRARRPGLILGAIRTIMREDPYVTNWLRLPLWAMREILVSLFPRSEPPARGSG